MDDLPSKLATAAPTRTQGLFPAVWRRFAAWIRSRVPALAPAVLGLVSLALFAPSIGADFVAWDDEVYIHRNPVIRDGSLGGLVRLFTSFHSCNYHPLTTLSYRAEYSLVGFSPWLYHLDNVLLHAAATVLCYFLVKRWLENAPTAFFTALLFAVHPLRVESVAWVGERKDVLCAVFFLASLIAYPSRGDARPGWKWALSFVFFSFALLSKVMAVSLPFAIATVLASKRQLRPRTALALFPFAVLSAVFAVLGVLAQEADGALGELHGERLALHLLTIPKALAFYAGKLIFPVPLSPRYMLEPAMGLGDPRVTVGLAIIAACVTGAVLSLKGRRIAFLGLGFFAVTWLPVSGIVPTSTIVADRYLYLPGLGIFLVLVSAVVSALRDPVPLRRRFGIAAAAAGAVWIVTCSAMTPFRTTVWQDSRTLWTNALRENPLNGFAYNQLALVHFREGRFLQAACATIDAGRSGLANPEFHFNLALAYRAMGQRDSELAVAREILALAPRFFPARTVLLRQALLQNDVALARDLQATLETDFVGHPGLLVTAAWIAEADGHLPDALGLYLAFQEIDPTSSEVQASAALVLEKLGLRKEAAELAEEATREPSFAASPGAWSRVAEFLDRVNTSGPPEDAARIRRWAEPALADRRGT